MSEEKTWVIQTDDLQVGTTLSFDLTDPSGNVLLRAGNPIPERLKELLRKKNINSVTVRGVVELGVEKGEAVLLASFDSKTVDLLNKSVESTQEAILQLVQKAQRNQLSNGDELTRCVNSFVEQASKDVAATLAIVALRFKSVDGEVLQKIANRATKLTLLSIVASITLKHDPKLTREIGLAASLHDASLVAHPEWFDGSGQRSQDFVKEYQRHPLESAEILAEVQGLSRNVITMITQVHEQLDGSGYPRGLKEDHLEPGSLILNLADAYLALTEPIQGSPYSKGDTLAYLCQHTARGKFSRETLHAFLNSMAIYPVGSMVELDDSSTAIVIGGNPGHPMKPIVKTLQGAQLRRIDLSNSSQIIVGPYSPEDSGERRIRKSQMQEVLWRNDR
jgi:HD-GYP domain-containing protein (c-di-GMP phosphodiesterase class II)